MKVKALTVLALDRLVPPAKRADHSVPLWSRRALSLRIQMLHTRAARSAPAVQADLPLLPPAHIDSLGLRCMA
ncbi:hypothetical protein A6X20_41505 [Bradyrhizobium elkanii]|nr:hypothetical protein A6X20_41505 [Bradyrhizobium elkanii]ODM71551.1 hypothetical protein A6452_41700 [Bradyrhizobium elkanii]